MVAAESSGGGGVRWGAGVYRTPVSASVVGRAARLQAEESLLSMAWDSGHGEAWRSLWKIYSSCSQGSRECLSTMLAWWAMLRLLAWRPSPGGWAAPGGLDPGLLLCKSGCVELNSVLLVHVHLETGSLHLLLRCGHPREGETLFQSPGDINVGVADVGPWGVLAGKVRRDLSLVA